MLIFCFFIINSVLSSLWDSFLSRLDLLLLLLQLFDGEKTNDELLVVVCCCVEGDDEAGCSDNGEVAAEGWIEDVVGFIEQSAIDDDDNEEQCRGVTHVEQLQQQLQENVQ